MATAKAPRAATEPTPFVKECLYVAFDIEKAGCRFEHHLLAVGACVATLADGVIAKRTWAILPQEGRDWEPRCIYEFWYQHPRVLERIAKEGKPLKEQMHSLLEWIRAIEAKYPDDQYNIVYLSDNPNYDLGQLDYYFCSETGEAPLRSRGPKMYRWVEDPSERLDALCLSSLKREVLRDIAPEHDHWPENDAQMIFWQHVLAMACSKLIARDGVTLHQAEETLLDTCSAKRAEARGTTPARALLDLARLS